MNVPTRQTVKQLLSELLSVRLGRFAGVGAMGAIIDNIALLALVEGGIIGRLVGKFGSSELSILSMFLINERWTFATARDGWLLARFVKSHIARMGGFTVGFLSLYALLRWENVSYLPANILGIGMGFCVNYVSESLFTWRVHR